MKVETFAKEERHPFVHKLHLFTIGYFIIVAITAVFIYQAAPSPVSEEIRGLGIGNWQEDYGMAFVSGRRLDCQPETNDPLFATHCEIDVAGKTLVVEAVRNDPDSSMMLLGDCEATYAGEVWPCKIDSRHVHVHWFAFIDPQGELDNAQMNSLRRTYFIENLSESAIIGGVFFVAIFTMLLLLTNFLVMLEPKVETKLLLVVWGLLVAFVTFFGTLIFAMWLTNGFWD